MNESQYPPLIYDDQDLQKLKDLKNKFVKRQDYDTAARLRDIEKVLMNNIDRDKELELKRIENNTSFTKEQVKSLLDNAVKEHEELIRILKNEIIILKEKNVKLEETVLGAANLGYDFAEYIVKNNCKINTTNPSELYDAFLDERFNPKNKAVENLDPDNGESLWVKTE